MVQKILFIWLQGCGYNFCHVNCNMRIDWDKSYVVLRGRL